MNLIVFIFLPSSCSGFPHQRFWNNRQRPGKSMQAHGPHLHRLRSKSLCFDDSLPRNLPGTELWRLGDREESGHCIISLYTNNRKLNGSITSPAFFYIGSQQTFALGLLLAILKSLCKCCSRLTLATFPSRSQNLSFIAQSKRAMINRTNCCNIPPLTGQLLGSDRR